MSQPRAQPDPVLRLVRDQLDVCQFLRQQGQESFALVVEREVPKFLVLSAASYFERRILDCIEAMTDGLGDERVSSLVRLKAIKRQYHTLFEWEKQKLGPFKTLFGDSVEDVLNERCKDDRFAGAVADFLTIGHERNMLVHGNFATYVLSGAVEEWMKRYENAQGFLTAVQEILRPKPRQ